MKTNVDYYFAKIIQEQKIQDWKAKDFWQAILSHGITENNINRQRLYGLLRKKAHENLLLKKCHPKNQQLSTYTETAKLLSFRKQPVLFNENYKKIQQKIEDMKDMRKHLHMEIHIADKIINDFPFIKEIVQDKKKKLQFELDELTAYVNFLIKL